MKPESDRSCIVPDEMDDVRFSEESMADFLVMCAIPCDVVGQWLLKLAKRPECDTIAQDRYEQHSAESIT